MEWKNKIGTALIALLMGAGLWGCDGAAEFAEQDAAISQPADQLPAGGVEPDIHINVPPPDTSSGSALPESAAQRFFEKRQQIKAFSPSLQAQIQQNIEQLPEPTDPANGAASSDPAAPGGPPVFFTMMGGTLPRPAFDGDCNPTEKFLCVDSPLPPEGFEDVFTTEAGLDITIRLDLNQLAVFSAGDPVAVISVFNAQGGSDSEVLIMPEDVQPFVPESGQPDAEGDIGQFQTAIGLSGFGKFTVVVSAYRVIDPGKATQSNDLFSKAFNIYRTTTAELEIVEAHPVVLGPPEIEKEAVEDGAVIAADMLRIQVKLTSPFSPGIQVRFENYDEDGLRRSFDVVGFTSKNEPVNEESYTGNLVLHQGLNEIQIIGRNPEAEHALGANAPAPSVLTFKVYNFFGAPKIKIMQPLSDQPLVVQTSAQGQKAEVQFCYTLVPELIVTGSGGGQPPADSDECISGDLGFEPRFYLNGRRIGGQEDDPNNNALDYNGAQGVFTARVTPDFGVNLFEIQVVDGQDSSGNDFVVSSDVGSFTYGVPVKLFEEGQIAEADSFTPRGVHLDIDKALLEGDIKELILKFVNRPETSDMVLKVFKKEAPTHGYTCQEVHPATESPGDTSIEFIPETFELGQIELLDFRTADDGMLHLSARINGMHGEADMVDLGGPRVYDGDQLISFIPLTLSIARLDVNLGVAFRRNDEGNLELDLKKISGQDVVNVIGDGPLGSFVSINADRNPYAAGMKFLDQQQGLVRKLFSDTLNGTFLCGIESGVNHKTTGILGKSVKDLEKLIGYDKNPFRLPLSFEFLGKTLGLDVALNVPKSEIVIDGEGIHVRGVPVRVNPASSVLPGLLNQFETGLIGALSRYPLVGEEAPQQNISNGIHKLGVEVAEDVINQALFTANLLGILNLDVDAAFYARHEIVPSAKLLPQGDMFLTTGMDINMNGDYTDDAKIPVMMKVRTDSLRPPMLSFLSGAEVQALATKEQEILDKQPTPEAPAEGEDPPKAPVKHFDANQRYFRVALSGLELSVFEQEPNPAAGEKKYCNLPLPHDEDQLLLDKGLCKVHPEAKALVPVENSTATCPDADIVSIPQGNGRIISRPVKEAGAQVDAVPLYRARVGLVLYGRLQGMNREVPAKDRVVLQNPEIKNIFRAKLVPNNTGLSEAYLVTVEVVENHTEQPDAGIVKNLKDFLDAAVGTDCSLFNEIKVPVKDSLEFDLEEEGLIKDLELAGLDLGATVEHLPEVFIDDNRLFLDVLVFADLKFVGE